MLPAAHPLAQGEAAVPVAALRDEVWAASGEGTGHHAMVLGTCRAHGGYEPDLRHRSDDADVQLELVRSAGVVTLLPDLALPAVDPRLAVRDVAGVDLARRLFVVTRDAPVSPALRAYLAALLEQGRRSPA